MYSISSSCHFLHWIRPLCRGSVKLLLLLRPTHLQLLALLSRLFSHRLGVLVHLSDPLFDWLDHFVVDVIELVQVTVVHEPVSLVRSAECWTTNLVVDSLVSESLQSACCRMKAKPSCLHVYVPKPIQGCWRPHPPTPTTDAKVERFAVYWVVRIWTDNICAGHWHGEVDKKVCCGWVVLKEVKNFGEFSQDLASLRKLRSDMVRETLEDGNLNLCRNGEEWSWLA